MRALSNCHGLHEGSASACAQVMDCGTQMWSTPPIDHGPVPVGREDSAWVYDNKTCSLLIFGGWANRWLGDTVKLNLSPIIGPPYACTSIEPEGGPVFGGCCLRRCCLHHAEQGSQRRAARSVDPVTACARGSHAWHGCLQAAPPSPSRACASRVAASRSSLAPGVRPWRVCRVSGLGLG